MREGIHPKFFPAAKIVCSCGNTWTTGSTREVIHADVCSKCHPFYTGEQRIVDTEGQVERFYKKLEAHGQHRATVEARQATKTQPEVMSIAALELDERVGGILEKVELKTVAQLLEKIAAGDEGFLALTNLGQKGLIDLKKRLRARGLLAEAAEAVEA